METTTRLVKRRTGREKDVCVLYTAMLKLLFVRRSKTLTNLNDFVLFYCAVGPMTDESKASNFWNVKRHENFVV